MKRLFEDPPVTLGQQVAEIDRELRQRAHVYPRQVAAGKMTQTRADNHTRVMQAVLETLCCRRRRACGE